MIFGVRHGERADFPEANKEERKLIENHIDPHLTKRGLKQAEATGKLIQARINQYEQELIKSGQASKEPIQAVILCSPFLRCIMTSYAIARQMKSVYKNSIFLQEHFCEYLSNWDFSSHPLNDLFIRNRPIEDLNKYVDLKGANISIQEPLFANKDMYVPKYLEKNMQQRVSLAVDGLKKFYFNTFQYNTHVIIFITHQYIVGAALKHYGSQIYSFEDIEYCGVMQVQYPNAFKKDFDTYKLLMEGDNSHISGIN